MTQYKTPNVYVEEISSSPLSVVSGATAVPAFIGYTEIAGNQINGSFEYHNTPVRITSMVEYENLFGKAYFPQDLFTLDLTQTKDNRIEANPAKLQFLLYYQLQMYFSNGGSVCYIVSVGQYGGQGIITLAKDVMLEGLEALRKEDEPTLIVLTDAINLDEIDYYDVCQQALQQCKDLKDRFVILDVPGEISTIDTHFRTKIGQNNLQYGAAYYPYLNTSLSYLYEDAKIADTNVPTCFVDIKDKQGNPALRIAPISPTVEVAQSGSSSAGITFALEPNTLKLIITIPGSEATVGDILEAWNQETDHYSFSLVGVAGDSTTISATTPRSLDTISLKSQDVLEFSATIGTLELIYSGKVPQLTVNKATEDVIVEKNKVIIGLLQSDLTIGQLYDNINKVNSQYISLTKLNSDNVKVAVTPQSFIMPSLDTIKILQSKLYFEIKAELDALRVTLPPSGAIAGVYASVDRDRGVWKAPANVSINTVIGPNSRVTDAEQEDLNVHDSGKSINVIRSFIGKGTLVWGSRTLAGNDNEWRYVPVRRLFNVIEKAIKTATSFAVFEPNTEMTWLKVRVMIENYLNELWGQGALAGSKAEDAYFVHVGLGTTMTAQDIAEGRMIAKIGIAAVRPAEFIIMQFSHLVQES